MKEKLTWFYAFEKELWGDKVASNPYLATLSLLFCALLGALVGGGNTLHSWFNTDTQVLLLTTLGVVGLIAVYNVGESILVSQTHGIAAARSTLLLLGCALLFGIGYVMAVVVMILVAAWLILAGVSGALSGSGSKGKKYTLDDGTEVVRETGLMGEESFREKYGSRRFERTSGDEVREV